jgi:ABC-type nickel/cobalt efflux system permease component RcnA
MDAALLMTTAGAIALAHAALGPDHYVPFAALGVARRWSMRRTLGVAALCGFAHLTASIALAGLVLWLGSAVLDLAGITAMRADAAAWLLVGFGVAYVVYGLRRDYKAGHRHAHEHVHADGTRHEHTHEHQHEHVHPHVVNATHSARSTAAVGWSLFIVFLFGPCEPLVPLVLAPVSQGDWLAAAGVVATFSAVTLATMLTMVWLLLRGLARLVGIRDGGRWTHTAAGASVAMCGVAMLMGL